MALQSPSYPSISLASALQSVAKIENVYRTGPVGREDAARLLGFSGLSGPANMALAALASYGLVERAGKGMFRVTPLARSILHPKDDKEKRESTRIAANSPKLYSEIRDHFDGLAVPPEAGVITFLNRQGFNPSAVPRAAKAFLETARLVEELSDDESRGGPHPAGVASPGAGSVTGAGQAPTVENRRERRERLGMKEDVYTLPEGDLVLQWPERLSRASFEEIEDWFRLMLRKLKRQTDADQAQEPTEHSDPVKDLL